MVGNHLSPLYAIADREMLDARRIELRGFAEQLRDGGVRLLQYRDKKNGPQEMLRAARKIADVFAGTKPTLILNDRADLAALLGWGVHVGQSDLSVEAARRLVGRAVVGVSTHNEAEVRAADLSSADYVAVGPVFATASKLDAEPVVGLDGVRRARGLTTKLLVAIGGVTMENAPQVREAGADSVAMISALASPGQRISELLMRCQGSHEASPPPS